MGHPCYERQEVVDLMSEYGQAMIEANNLLGEKKCTTEDCLANMGDRPMIFL